MHYDKMVYHTSFQNENPETQRRKVIGSKWHSSWMSRWQASTVFLALDFLDSCSPPHTAQYSIFISKWGKGNEWRVRSGWLSGARSLLSNHCFPYSIPVEDCKNSHGSSPLPVSILFTMQPCSASQQEVKSNSIPFQFGPALSLTEMAEVSVCQDLT